MEVDEGSDQIQTSSPIGWLSMRVWRISLGRTKSAIISWDGSDYWFMIVLFMGMIIGLLTFLKPSFITDGLRGANVDRDSSSTFTKWNFQNSPLAVVISLILLNSLSVSIWNVEVMTCFNSLIWNSDILFMCMWEQMSHATNDNSHTHFYVFVRTNEPSTNDNSHMSLCVCENKWATPQTTTVTHIFMCLWEQMSHATNNNSHTHLYVFVRTNEPCHKRQQSHVFMCMWEQMTHATNDNSHTHLYVYVRTNEPVFEVLWPKLIKTQTSLLIYRD